MFPFKEVCECSDNDFECDFGFKPSNESSDKLNCVPLDLEQMEKLSVCYHKLYEKHEHLYNTSGYRKVSGDVCSGGKESQFMSKPVYHFELLCKNRDVIYANESMKSISSRTTSHTITLVFGLCLLLVTLLVLALLAVYLVRKRTCPISVNAFHLPVRRTSQTPTFAFYKFQDDLS